MTFATHRKSLGHTKTHQPGTDGISEIRKAVCPPAALDVLVRLYGLWDYQYSPDGVVYKPVADCITRPFRPSEPALSNIMFTRTALLSLAALAAAKELPKDEVRGAQLYDSGIRHANNVALKEVINIRR